MSFIIFNISNLCVIITFLKNINNMKNFILTLLTKVFVARLLLLGILFSVVVNEVFVARLLMSGITFSILLTKVFVARLLMSVI